MSAAHTPGPWLHDTNGHPGPDVRAASGRAVAATWMVCKNVPKTTEGFQARQDEDRANARLIAAAPTMYEYIALSASNGCAEARKIMEAINAGR